MIIWGTRNKVSFIASLITMCAVCAVNAPQGLSRIRSWFTLFFIPLFPVGHGTYIMKCGHCGKETRLRRADAEGFIQAAAEAQAAGGSSMGAMAGYQGQATPPAQPGFGSTGTPPQAGAAQHPGYSTPPASPNAYGQNTQQAPASQPLPPADLPQPPKY